MRRFLTAFANFFKKPKWFRFTWHIFPTAKELSLKSFIEMLGYAIVFISLIYFYNQINIIKNQNLTLRLAKIDDNYIIPQTSAIHGSHVEIIIPFENEKDERTAHVKIGFNYHPDIVRTYNQAHADSNFFGGMSIYRNALRYVNENYFSELQSLNRNNLINRYVDKNHIGYSIMSNLKDVISNNEEIAYSYFGNEPEFKILYSKILSFELKSQKDSLRSKFDNKISPFININELPKKTRYPLYFYGISFEYKAKDWSGDEVIQGKDNLNNTRETSDFKKYADSFVGLVYSYQIIKDNTYSFNSFRSGEAQLVEGLHNSNDISLGGSGNHPFKSPSMFSLYDISQCKYHIKIETSEIDSIYFKMDFCTPCEFSNMYPTPDEITPTGFAFHDQWKILQIKKNGLDLIARPNYFKNLQSMRLFVIQAIISALLIIFFSFFFISFIKSLVSIKKIGKERHNIKEENKETEGDDS